MGEFLSFGHWSIIFIVSNVANSCGVELNGL
jgi:hypothetical protein